MLLHSQYYIERRRVGVVLMLRPSAFAVIRGLQSILEVTY